jgi:predicted enzyme related to lactoylglutathione lyase
MPRVNHFDMSAEDPDRAMKFYQNVFGWSFVKWEGPMDYWMFSTGEGESGIDGGLSRKSEMFPPIYLTIEVPGIDDFIERVEANGGRIMRAKMAIPGVGWFAMFQDPEGNAFGLMENDESAR